MTVCVRACVWIWTWVCILHPADEVLAEHPNPLRLWGPQSPSILPHSFVNLPLFFAAPSPTRWEKLLYVWPVPFRITSPTPALPSGHHGNETTQKKKKKQERSDFRKSSFWFTRPAAFSTDLQSWYTEMQIQVSCRLSGELRCHSEMCWFMSWINNKNKRRTLRWVDLIHWVLPFNANTCTPCTSEGNIVLFTPLHLFTPSKIQCYRLNLQAAYKIVSHSSRMLVTHWGRTATTGWLNDWSSSPSTEIICNYLDFFHTWP